MTEDLNIDILAAENEELKKRLKKAEFSLNESLNSTSSIIHAEIKPKPLPLLTKIRDRLKPFRSVRYSRKIQRPFTRIVERYAAGLTLVLAELPKMVERAVLPHYEGWVRSGEHRLPEVRMDAHIKKPGSKGGHIIGYRNGEPIYGRVKRKAKDWSEAWEFRKFHKAERKGVDPYKSLQEGKQKFISAVLGNLKNKLKHLPIHIEDPGDATSRYIHIKGVVIRVADHPPAQEYHEGKWMEVGGFKERGGYRHSAADISLHPGSPSKISEAVALAEWAMDKRKKKPVLDSVHLDDEYDVISAIFNNIRVNILERETELTAQARREAQRAAAATNGQNLNNIKEVVERVLKVDPFEYEPWLVPEARNWVTENVSLIKSVGRDYLGDVEKIIYRMVREGASLKDTRNELVKRFDVSRNRARLIARDQVSKFNGQLTHIRQVNIGVKEYEWKTVEDQRVRGNPAGKYPKAVPSHYVMEGLKCRWDDPTIYFDKDRKKWVKRTGNMPKTHPNEEIQCRCIALPILDELLGLS